MAKVEVDPAKVRAFESAADFERWLRREHDREQEVWLRIYKKASGVTSVTHAEALDVALCWGWIDAIRKSYDELSFLQRFTRRRPKSIWSQINREHVARLVAAGRMQPAGLREVEAAKADGRWQAAYASARTATLPDDLLAAIAKNRAASATLATLTSQNRFALMFRLHQVKTPAARERRIATFVDMLARGEAPHPNGAGGRAAKTKAAAPAVRRATKAASGKRRRVAPR